MRAPPWTSTTAPSHRTIRISRSRLSLLRRCRTAATIRPRTPDRPQTYRRIQPLALPRGRPYYDGLSLVLAQKQAIRRWRTPRHPEYVTLAKRTRTFYDTVGWRRKAFGRIYSGRGIFLRR